MNHLQKQAEDIVKITKVTTFFSGLGEICFVGSYAYKAMTRRDIDFFVLTSQAPSLQKANLVTKALIETNTFQTVEFANCFDFETKDKPKGYYWEIIYRYNKRDWKFDVWYGNNREPKLEGVVETTEKLTRVLTKSPQKRKWLMSEKKKIIRGTYSKGKKYELYRDLINNNH